MDPLEIPTERWGVLPLKGWRRNKGLFVLVPLWNLFSTQTSGNSTEQNQTIPFIAFKPSMIFILCQSNSWIPGDPCGARGEPQGRTCTDPSFLLGCQCLYSLPGWEKGPHQCSSSRTYSLEEDRPFLPCSPSLCLPGQGQVIQVRPVLFVGL